MRSQIAGWADRLRGMNLRTRLQVSFFLISIVPLVIIGTSAFYITSRTISRIVSTQAFDQVELLSRNLDLALRRVADISNTLSTNIDLINAVREYRTADTRKRSETYQVLQAEAARASVLASDLFSIELFDSTGIIFNLKYRLSSEDSVVSNPIVLGTLKSGKRMNWYAYSSDEFQGSNINPRTGIVASTKIIDFRDNTTIGVLNLTFLEKSVFGNLWNIDFGGSGGIFVCNSEGKVVGSHTLTGSYRSVADEIALEITSGDTSQVERRLIPYAGNSVGQRTLSYVYTESHLTGWKIFAVLDRRRMLESVTAIGWLIGIVILVNVGVIIPLSILVTHSVSMPLGTILRAMDRIEENNFDVRIEDTGRDELAFLAGAFNRMSERIRTLISEVYEARVQQKESELHALQSQINPHFIYNTLDSINWMAYSAGQLELCSMVGALSKFLRLSLNEGRDTYTIAKEKENIENYVTIQSIRHRSRIRFHLTMFEEADRYLTLKTLVQPLVENAIFHGLEKHGRTGNVWIEFVHADDEIHMIVGDDGCGIESSGTVEEAWKTDESRKKGSGYGIRNLRERIQLYYGKQYGVTLKARPGGGTVATIIIPAVQQKEG